MIQAASQMCPLGLCLDSTTHLAQKEERKSDKDCPCKLDKTEIYRVAVASWMDILYWMQLFCLQLEASSLQWSFFSYNWQF